MAIYYYIKSQLLTIIKKQKMLDITILATPMLYDLGITHC
jgi:hypothetical protein